MNWLSRAPANLMLLGEHSVVYGEPALACAVNQFIEIEWQANDDDTMCIESALADYQFTLQELKHAPLEHFEHPKLRFVIQALRAFAPYLQHGLNMHIRSEFSSTIGLGSSAAVLAASLHGLNRITQQKINTLALFDIGLDIIQNIQGRGSGTDLAASLSGGLILFEPGTAKHSAQIFQLNTELASKIPLSLIYSGYKTPTADVLQQVVEKWHTQNDLQNQLYQLMGQTTRNACEALQQNDMPTFYGLIETYQGLMEALGVSDATLSRILYQMRGCESLQACKISGSGLGDCLLGIGDLSDCPEENRRFLEQYQHIEVELTPQGATTETLN